MAMFWGLVLEPGKKYEQKAEASFHLTMAALEPSTKTPTPNKSTVTSVLLESNKTQFILCNLDQQRVLQQPLDCVFTEGEPISFSVNGENKVHLTGYIMPDSDSEDFDGEMYDSDEEDSEAELMNDKKRKLALEAKDSSKKVKLNEGKPVPVKGAKADVQAKGGKKAKIADLKGGDEDEDDEDDEDESMDSEEMNNLLDQFDEEDDDDEEDEDEEDESSPEAPKPPKQKQNQKATPAKPAGPQKQNNQKTPQQGQQQNQQQKKPFSPYSGGKQQFGGGKGKGQNFKQNQNQNSGKKGTPQNKFGGSPGNKKPWAQKK